MSMLLIILWYDANNAVHRFFAVFLMLIIIWNVGFLLLQASTILDVGEQFTRFANGLVDVGFASSSVAIYVFTSILVGIHSRWFRILALSSIIVVVGYNIFLIVNSANISPETNNSLAPVFYLIYDSITIYVVWYYRRKFRHRTLIIGILIFVIGQGVGFLNAETGVATVSTSISAIGTLIISFSIIRQAIIQPLHERISQVEAIHNVSLAMTSQIATDDVLTTIAEQAARWLNADASGIFLAKNGYLNLVTGYGLPAKYINTKLQIGEGLAGRVLQTRKSIMIENYQRDWLGTPDVSLARITFGSTLCVPLIYAQKAIGAIMVIASKQGRLFQQDDMHLLELLSAQAAVVISHGELFSEQRALTSRLEIALNQLRTVLSSTENPVIALDRQLKVIFANSATHALLGKTEITGEFIGNIISEDSLSFRYRDVVRDVKKAGGGHIYEISFGDRVYLCNLAPLGGKRIEGWVAVLNDVTELKELDRIKSEMIRMTSHDLKNPLQAAIANLDLLRDDVDELNNKEVSLSINIIDQQLIRMHRIINGILDLERVRSGKGTSEMFDLGELATDTLSDWQEFADRNHVKLSLQIENNLPRIVGDKQQFERALANLVENAIKFCVNDGEGEVGLRIRSKAEAVLIEVQDNGVGIPSDIQPRIFERFFRGQQKGIEHVSGSGLGLSLVKAVVENHGGNIEIESVENQGTTFRIGISGTYS
jgi:signal transduction histidine kinase